MFKGLNMENLQMIKNLNDKIDKQHVEILEHQRQLKLVTEKLQDETINQSQIDEYKKNLSSTMSAFQDAQIQINNLIKQIDKCHFPKIYPKLKQKINNIATMFKIIDDEMNGCPVEDIQYMKDVAPIIYDHEQFKDKCPNMSAKKYHKVCDPVWEKTCNTTHTIDEIDDTMKGLQKCIEMREQSLIRCPRRKWDTGHMLAIDHIKNNLIRCKDARIKKLDTSYAGYVPKSYIQPAHATEVMESVITSPPKLLPPLQSPPLPPPPPLQSPPLPPPPFTSPPLKLSSNPIHDMKTKIFDRRGWEFTTDGNISQSKSGRNFVVDIFSPDGKVLGTGVASSPALAKKYAAQNVLDNFARRGE